MIPRSHRIEQGIRTCLSFHIHGLLFGVDARVVQKIARYQLLAVPRGMPHCLCGLYRHQGLMIPVIDISQRFGHEKLEPGGRTCIVIVELGVGKWRKEVGLLADEVRGLGEFPADDLKPMPEVINKQIQVDVVEGLVRLDRDYLVVLDHLRLLTDTESIEVAEFLKGL